MSETKSQIDFQKDFLAMAKAESLNPEPNYTEMLEEENAFLRSQIQAFHGILDHAYSQLFETQRKLALANNKLKQGQETNELYRAFFDKDHEPKESDNGKNS